MMFISDLAQDWRYQFVVVFIAGVFVGTLLDWIARYLDRRRQTSAEMLTSEDKSTPDTIIPNTTTIRVLEQNKDNLFFGFSRGGRELSFKGYRRARAHLSAHCLRCEPLFVSPGEGVTVDVWTAEQSGEWLLGVGVRSVSAGDVICINLVPVTA